MNSPDASRPSNVSRSAAGLRLIASVNFVQGREVAQGEVLFVIDPRPYEAALKQAQAQLAQARSQLTLATSEQDRADKRVAAHAISREELESRDAALRRPTPTWPGRRRPWTPLPSI